MHLCANFSWTRPVTETFLLWTDAPILTAVDSFEHDLNPWFSDRVHEMVIHDADLQAELPKRDHPDRIYGLKSTKSIQRLLDAIEERIKSDSDSLFTENFRSSPFRAGGDPLLFPFLVLEAKSEKGQDFASIERQTAFSLCTLLKILAQLQLIQQR